VSYRLQVTVADDVADELESRAQTAGQPASRVAAMLINLALTNHAQTRAAMAAHSPATISTRPTRPSWLEPHDPAERRFWRRELWLAVLALCARYPRALDRLVAEWWRRTSRIEHLAALEAWLLQIDRSGQDPREELAFQAQLADLHHTLERTPGIGANTFDHGLPPNEWLDPAPR
jgi:hypothetical protein